MAILVRSGTPSIWCTYGWKRRIAIRRCIVLVLLLVWGVVGRRIDAQTVPDLNADSGSWKNSAAPAPSDPAGTDDSMDWLFPVHKLNRSLPSWFRIGGEYRGRLEGPTEIGFAGTDDFSCGSHNGRK